MPSRPLEARINQVARCACRRCVAFLLRELERYTSSITRFERPLPLKDQDDVRQEAGVALVRALDDWEGEGSFKAYYGTVLANHMASLNRWFTTQGRGGEQPLSLDADAFVGSEDSRVALIDTVPDRSLDTATIVMIRESIFEYLASVDDASRRACIAYEAHALVA